MSEENVAVVRELLEQFQHRQHEASFAHYDPEIVFDATDLGLVTPDLAGTYHGHDGVRAYWRNWLSAWSDLHFEIDDVRDGGDRVVALISGQRQWGRHSGIEFEAPPYAIVFTFRGGKVIHWKAFSDRPEALRWAGIEPG
jgi:ketosteroid isomerase-like protein